MVLVEYAEGLANVLRDNLREELRFDPEAALMFSGGVDSAALAVLARKTCDLQLYISGLEGSHDLKWGCQCADLLDLPYTCLKYKRKDVLKSLENVVTIHGMDNPRWMSTFVAFDLVLQHVEQKLVLCGQGADELFGGYKKYRSLEHEESKPMMEQDLIELRDLELPAYQCMASHYGRTLVAPYLEESVISYSAKIPMRYKVGKENKQVLRMAARYLGVPETMAGKPKKAMQYGSGVSKIIKGHIKSSGKTLDEIINDLKQTKGL